ncbi:ATP-binding cassette domain-containing protein, partial [Streptomyces luteogriseus]
MTVAPGESVAITGASGSGKSTLLACILGLTKPDSGRIVVADQDVTRLRHAQLAKLRNQNIGVVFQFGELLPELSPVDNVALAPMLARENSADAYRKARTLLNELGVPDASTTAELSGGEHQRTAV